MNKIKVLFSVVLSIIILLSASTETISAESNSVAEKKSSNFEVRDLSGGSKPQYFSNYTEASKALEKGSSTTVIFRDKSIVATKPKQSYVYFPTTNTVNIYKYKDNLTSNTLTYITGNYKMYYYGTQLVGNTLVAEVEINGGRGYVNVNNIKFLPFYNREFTDDYYLVRNINGFNELSVYYHKQNGSENSITYAAAPKWLKPGKYYSPDGIRFYYDRTLSKPVKNGNEVGQFYAYYQWLPLRTLSNINTTDISNHLALVGHKNKSVITKKEHLLINNGKIYGTNPMLLYAQAALESSYGTHSFAQEGWNNLFGWNAFDSDPAKATKYDSLETAIKIHSAVNLGDYMDNGDWRNEGPSFGNKGSGITVRYASDPFYGQKIASIAYSLDRNSGYKEYNAYNLAKLNDNQDMNVRKQANTTGGTYYTTKKNKINQIFTDLGSVNNFMKTNLTMPLVNGEVKYSTKENLLPIDLENEFGYMHLDYITKFEKHGPVKGKVIKEDVYASNELLSYKVDTSSVGYSTLRVRSETNTNSNVLTILNHGDEFSGYFVSNGWIKTTVNGKSGYVSAHYAERVFEDVVEIPQNPTYKLGDVNNDGEIDGFDMMAIKRHYLDIRKLDGVAAKAADVNKDGEIDGFDMLAIKRHYLQIKLIVE